MGGGIIPAFFVAAAVFGLPCGQPQVAVVKSCKCEAVPPCKCKPVAPCDCPSPEEANKSTMRFAVETINRFNRRFDAVESLLQHVIKNQGENAKQVQAINAELILIEQEFRAGIEQYQRSAGAMASEAQQTRHHVAALRPEVQDEMATIRLLSQLTFVAVLALGLLLGCLWGKLGRMRKCLFALLALLPATAQAQVQLASPQKLANMRATFPQTVDAEWQQFASNPWTLYYTNREVPPAYQFAAEFNATTFHSPSYNISGDTAEMVKGHGNGGNGNIEFPWKHPGGTDSAAGRHNTYRMMLLPDRGDGRRWPLVYWREVDRTAKTGPVNKLCWIYPVGTRFAEVLCQARPDGYWQAYEVRVRTRLRESWSVNVLRPFPEYTDLVVALKAHGAPAELVANVERPVNWQAEKTLRDKLHRRSGFESTAAVEVLPEIPAELSVRLLAETPFRDAAGYAWRETEGGADCFAPTTEQDFSIVPKGYRGTFLGTDSQSCRQCHESTGVHVDHFDPVRQWYGHIRGSTDGIFTFHPIAPSSISYNGGAIPVQFRRAFVEAGMVEPYDRDRHPAEVYSMLAKEEHIR